MIVRPLIDHNFRLTAHWMKTKERRVVFIFVNERWMVSSLLSYSRPGGLFLFKIYAGRRYERRDYTCGPCGRSLPFLPFQDLPHELDHECWKGYIWFIIFIYITSHVFTYPVLSSSSRGPVSYFLSFFWSTVGRWWDEEDTTCRLKVTSGGSTGILFPKASPRPTRRPINLQDGKVSFMRSR